MKEKGIYLLIVAAALATALSLLSKTDSSANEAPECIIAPHKQLVALTQKHREMVLVAQILPPETELVPESATITTRIAEQYSPELTRLRVKVRRWVSPTTKVRGT
jgi:hypothetical protein